MELSVFSSVNHSEDVTYISGWGFFFGFFFFAIQLRVINYVLKSHEHKVMEQLTTSDLHSIDLFVFCSLII